MWQCRVMVRLGILGKLTEAILAVTAIDGERPVTTSPDLVGIGFLHPVFEDECNLNLG